MSSVMPANATTGRPLSHHPETVMIRNPKRHQPVHGGQGNSCC
jgi:hypothetical protein